MPPPAAAAVTITALRGQLTVLRNLITTRETQLQEARARLQLKMDLIHSLKSNPKEPRLLVKEEEAEEEETTRMQMRHAIHSLADVDGFLASRTAGEFIGFVQALNQAAAASDATITPSGEMAVAIMKTHVFDKLHSMLDMTPPETNTGLMAGERFGNRAFRTWHKKISDAAIDMATRTLQALSSSPATHESAAIEFATYLPSSFGDAIRLDYGTGHEVAFVMLMYAVCRRGLIKDLKALVLMIFPEYMRLVRRIRKLYRLEPAGSHGVWSLDDYHFLPFVFGSAQFLGQDAARAAATPKQMLHFVNAADFQRPSTFNMLADAIVDILDSKRGPFNEHSPMLYELGTFKTWQEINSGLLRMWRGEVLGKFPVAQHFWFGPTLPVTWEMVVPPAVGAATVVGPPPGGHFAAHNIVVSSAVGYDPLSKYFRRNEGDDVAAAATPDTTTIDAVNYTLVRDGAGVIIRPGGSGNVAWVFDSVADGKISSEVELETIRVESNGILDFPLPEMVFGKNTFSIVNEASGFSYQVNAATALWGAKLNSNATPPDRRMLKVKMADAWLNRADADGNVIKTWREDFDWTFTTHYGGTFTSKSRTGDQVTGQAALKITPRRIDYERLKLREPIIWNKQILFFEDDLFDMGLSKFLVKVRVMPSCFFVLTRLFVRVDKNFFRAFDTRVFHVFGSKVVLVEVSKREADYDEHLHGNFKADDVDALVQVLPLIEPAKTFEVAC